MSTSKELGVALAGALVASLLAVGDASSAPADAVTPQTIDNGTRIDINQVEMVVTNHGSFAYDLIQGNSGLFYPAGTQNTVVYASGLWFGAKVNGDTLVTVGEYSQEYSPGTINPDGSWTDSGDSRYRVYKIDWTQEGFELSDDYINWPFEDGAPADTEDPDYNENDMSTWKPLHIGDQTLWSVFHDMDPEVHTNDAGASDPLGIEVRQLTFAFDRKGGLGNTVFTKLEIVNKGQNRLEDAYVSIWSDPDLGGAGDDLVGCDTDLSLGYCYNVNNNDQLYSNRPPAVGYDFFQGPIVPSLGDTAYVSGVPVPDYRNLPMTSFNKYVNGTDPHSFKETYNYMLGLNSDGSPVIDEVTGEETLFQVPGDPVTGTGWLDTNAADRRMMLSSGPFTMEPGETQEVVVGIVVARGTDRLSSVGLLKVFDKQAQEAYDVNFDLPAPPPRPVVHAREFDGAVDLYWEPYSTEDYEDGVPIEINERLGVRYAFEGYNVWQGESVAGPWKKLVTFDRDTDLTAIYSDVINEDIGVFERQLVQTGNDNGVEYHIQIDGDAINGGPLINYKEYYFAVTAYSVELNHLSVYANMDGEVLGSLAATLENSQQAIPLMPKGSAETVQQFATHAQGLSDGAVQVDYVDQTMITNDTYRVTFHDNPDEEDELLYLWNLTNVTTGEVVLENMRNQTTDFTNPITDGFIAQVVGPPLAIKETVWGPNAADRWLTWVDAGLSGFNGGIGLGSEFFGSNLTVPQMSPRKVEIRFSSNEADWTNCQTYRRDQGYAAAGTGTFPGSAWDVADPNNPVRLNICFVENADASYPEGVAPDLKWNPVSSDLGINGAREYLFIMNSEYTGEIIYGDETEEDPRLFGPEADVVFAAWLQTRGARAFLGTDATFVWSSNGINTSEDVFEFTAKPGGVDTGTSIDNDLAKIRAVPNPYFNQSSYELNQFDRVLRFINLPNKKCTIRIFNLAGELVRTLAKDDVAESVVRWDLDNRAGIPVASGIYLYHVEAEGLGDMTGKLAVFVEKERLRNF